MRAHLVPADRLIAWFAAVVLPAATVAAVAPSTMLLAGAVLFALIGFFVLDAATSTKRLDEIEVQLPELVRLVKGREGTMEIRIRNTNQQRLRLRVGLPFPPEIAAASSDIVRELPERVEYSRWNLGCRPLDRGSHFLNRCFLEVPSRFGFWNVRKARSVRCELRSYPDLLGQRKQLAAVFLNRGLYGRHAHRQIGKGRDFEKLREYVPGDSFEEIHWKATARRGHPITKVFQIERTQEVYAVIDASRLSARWMPSANLRQTVEAQPPKDSEESSFDGRAVERPATALERFITASLVLGLAAEQHGDFFGLLVFSDRIQSFVRAKNGRAHFNACRDALYALRPQTVTPDFDEAASFIRLRLRRRALLVFMTALDDPTLAESFVRNVELISGQHVILVNMIRPKGLQPFFDDRIMANQRAIEEVSDTNGLYERLGGHLLWRRLLELEKILKRRGVRLSLVEREQLTAQVVTQYLTVKARQLL